MRRSWKAAAAALLFAACAAQAHEYRIGDLVIDHPWARPTAGPNTPGAAYMTVRNQGQEAETLAGAASPDAGKVEVHENLHDANGVMRMRAVEGGLKIPPGGTVELKPGGYHLMLTGLKHDLKEGGQIPLTLTFARAGNVDVDVKIEKTAGAEMHDHH